MEKVSQTRLCAFLVEAKRRTYAGLDDDATIATPLLAGSKQLEYREADLAYRDIYFGMSFFVGQETVQSGERTIWSMSYAGGTFPTVTDRAEVLATYAFLRKALLAVDPTRPFRGPAEFEEGGFRYVNTVHGDVAAFHGEEQILRAGSTVYALRYQGGLIR
jgi:hypothetical protein